MLKANDLVNRCILDVLQYGYREEEEELKK